MVFARTNTGGNFFSATLFKIGVFSLILLSLFFDKQIFVIASTQVTTFGTGSDITTSVTLAPGATATSTSAFTLQTSTSTATVSQVTVNLNGGIRNDGVSWATSSYPQSNNNWASIAYGDGLFVAVASAGTAGTFVMTSPDGITWTSRNASADSTWRSVTYGNGLFVAVASGGTNRVMTSPDGITWTSRSISAISWYGVTYGNGLFVAAGTGGASNSISTSPDGITWTTQTHPASNLLGVTYGNGLFVAFGSSGVNRVMTSPDGITWTTRTISSTFYTAAGTYGNGIFVLVSGGGTSSEVITSPDGITWTPQTTPSGKYWGTIAYGNGLFVAGSNAFSNDALMTSPDGVVWTLRSDSMTNSAWNGIAYGGGSFVAVSSGKVVVSSSGITQPVVQNKNSGVVWNTATHSTANQWNSVAYGNGLFVALAETGTGNRVMTSPDGVIWTTRTSAADNTWYGITYGNGMFVGVASSGVGNRVMTSPDGITWTSRTSAADNGWFGVTYGNGKFVAVAETCTGNCVMTSPDGITWTTRTTPVNNSWRAVAFGNGRFVAVSKDGTGNRVMRSDDGVTWATSTSAADNAWKGVTYGNGLFVAVADSGTGNRVMTSPDGITWTIRTSAANNGWFAVTYGNGLFVATSYDGGVNSIMTSPDGITWTLQTTPNDTNWRGIAYGNGRFVTVSTSATNRVMTSNSGYFYNLPNLYQGVSKVEITNDNGSTVYGSTTSMTGDLISIPITTNILTASTTPTQYKIRITPKTQTNLPGSATGTDVILTPKVVSFSATSSLSFIVEGDDSVATTTIIDNLSPDPYYNLANSWASSTNILSDSWESLTYGNGLFVAVSATTTSNKNITTSPDGITWTLRTGTTTNSWRSITYGNGLFVAVSYDGANRVMTSPDGITWTARNVGTGNSLVSVTYGNELFVAVACGVGSTNCNSTAGSRVMTSPDGITWTSRGNSSDTNFWIDVTYGNGLYVAITGGGTSNNVMTSPDGISWKMGTIDISVNDELHSITFGDGKFVVVGFNDSDYSPIAISQDGLIWNVSQLPINGFSATDITYGNGLFVTIPLIGEGSSVLTSSDAITWYPQPGATNGNRTSVAYGNGTFVIVSHSGTSGRAEYASASSSGVFLGNAQVTLTYIDPKDTSAVSLIALRSATSTINTSDIPVEGTSYSLGNTIGSSTVACIDNSITPGISDSCVVTGLTNGSSYYFALYALDMYGNYSYYKMIPPGLPAVPLAPAVTTLGNGSSLSSQTITPGASATVADAFTLRTDKGTNTLTQTLLTLNGGQENNGLTWVSRTSAADNSWTSVTYGNGLFVAVANSGTGNRVMTSPDGITWTSRTSAADHPWISITYGNGLFVAVSQQGIGNVVMSSPDGITWTSRTSAASDVWNSVTYGNGLFVAVAGTGNRVMTSPDGITWTSRVAGINVTWQSVTYGNGLFVAVAYDGTGNRVMTSPDGITWTSRTSAADNNWRSVTYGNGLFVAIACGVNASSCNSTAGNRVMTSPDGITWTTRTTPTNTNWNSVIYGNGLFIAVASSGTGNRVMTSPDGITWTSRTSAADNNWTSVVYGNGIFVAVSTTGTGNRVMTSDSGITQQVVKTNNNGVIWATSTSAADNTWYKVTYGNGLFVAISSSGTGNRVMTSPDGITWTSRTSAADSSWRGITYGNATFVAVACGITAGGCDGNAGTRVMTSPDGITWTSRTAAANNSWLSITYGNGLFVAVSDQWYGNINSRVMTSSDGITWTSRTAAANNDWNSIAYGNGLFVAAALSCSSNCVMTSPDGITWTSRTAAANNSWTSVTYGKGLFVAVSSSGTGNRVMTSPDGITWTSRTSAADNSWKSVTYGKGLFVAVSSSGTGNRVMTSPDGITWTSRTSVVDNTWNGIAYDGNGLFVAVSSSGSGNRVMTSSSGYNYNNPSLYQGVSKVEITNDAGTIVYGETNNPTSDTISIPLTTNTLTVGTTTTQYKVRITPKSHVNMPAPSLGEDYVLTPRVISFSGTAGRVEGEDSVGGVTMVDNKSSDINQLQPNNFGTNKNIVLHNNVPGYLENPLIAYGNGIFVAVGRNDYSADSGIYSSADGLVWTARTGTSNSFEVYTDIIFANGLFVLVGSNTTNHIMTSSDGITWTPQSVPADYSWRKITYGNGLFVVTNGAWSGTGNDIMTSPDGITWTLRNVGLNKDWGKPIFANGLFVVISSGLSACSSSCVITSPDGITWTARSDSSINYSMDSITYGNNQFVLLLPWASCSNNCVATSPDGITWTTQSVSNSLRLTGIIFAQNKYWAISGSSREYIMYSNDGQTWTQFGDQLPQTVASWNGALSYSQGRLFYVSGTGFSQTSPISLSISDSKITSSLITASSSDLSSILTLYSTSPITTDPAEGVSYATSSSVGGATVGCSSTVTASTTYTCIINGLTNGQSYYVKVYSNDTSGNWSVGISPSNSPITVNKVTTLGTGSDLTATTTLNPSDVATTTNSFTFVTDSGTDTVTSITVTYSQTNSATSTSLLEITNDAGTVVYGSLTNPTSDTPTVTLSTPVTVTTTPTQYKIRITPKTHVDMPQPQGGTYTFTTRVSDWAGTNVRMGTDTAGQVMVSDNNSANLVNHWSGHSVTASSNEWFSVTYGNNTFVAVADNGTSQVMTSPDGITWTSHSTPVNNSWYSVTYGNGLFVAVSGTGTGNRVMTSPDGITWTSRTSAADNNWTSVTYGNGLFVAVSSDGTGNRVMTSPDGITWTSRTSAADNNWTSVTYGNGLFVAVSCGMICADPVSIQSVMTSPDGITWTSRTSAADNNWRSVTYGKGLFVAVAASGNGDRIMTSSDGISWTTQMSTEDNDWNSVAYGNGLFVAVAYNNYSKAVMVSLDGINWSPQIGVADYGWSSVAYGNNMFTAVAWSSADNNAIMTMTPISISSTNQQNVLSFTTPSDTDLASILVLASTSPITISPTEGVSYATSSSVGGATAICSYSVATSTAYTCTHASLTNGTGYYYALYTKDTIGNYSLPSYPVQYPAYPGSFTTTLGTGNEPVSTITLAPGATATTSDEFTFVTSTGSDSITSLSLSLSASSSEALSLIEITNQAGGTVYGSLSNPTTDTPTITLSTPLSITTSTSTYAIRITPKSHATMPAVPGTLYSVTSRVVGWAGSGGHGGWDYTGKTINIDNGSPLKVTAGSLIPQTVLSFEGNEVNLTMNNEWSYSSTTPTGTGSSVQSNGDGPNTTMTMSYSITVPADTPLYFYRKVSSEENYDFLTLYIDTVFIDQWSGEIPYSKVGPYTLTAGAHTIEWKYSRDASTSAGDDAAWVDTVSIMNLGPIATSSSTTLTLSYTTPPDSDLSSVTILRSLSPISDTLTEGVTYSTSTTVGSSTVICYNTGLATGTPYSCGMTGLTNGTPYYFRLYTQDTNGNYSLPTDIGPYAAGGRTITLLTATDTPSTTLAPGGTATTSDYFSFVTDTGTDTISSLTLQLATSTSQALSLIEILNATSSAVLGTLSNPTNDTPTVTLSTSITATTATTSYAIRITPKSHVNMPAIPGAIYNVTTKVISWASGSALAGNDTPTVSGVVTVDNLSPGTTTSAIALRDTKERMIISYRNPSGNDLESVLVLRSTVLTTDSPIEGVTYSQGNTIGSSVVVCNTTGVTANAFDSCIYTNPPRSQKYHFRIFAKDSTGNYSQATVPFGSPLYISAPNGGGTFSAEAEIQTKATTTVSGGGQGGGTGTQTGTTTTATTTASTTTPIKGGGGGDVGINYNGSNFVVAKPSGIRSFFSALLGGAITYGSQQAVAETELHKTTVCRVHLASLCILK